MTTSIYDKINLSKFIKVKSVEVSFFMAKFGTYLLAILFFLVGCNNNVETQINDEVPEIIEVTVETIPDELKVNEEVIIQAKITQGEDIVKDADEMQFEIWKEGQSDQEHVKVEGELDKKEGEYYIKKTFTEPGLYFVIAHVTARGMHNIS